MKMQGTVQALTLAESKQPPELSNILEYYRQRVDQSQKERDDWFERLERLRISQEDFHRLEWEVKKRNGEIFDLQKALSESQVAFFDEREQVMALKREMEDYKLNAIEDRQKILQLVTLGAKEDENKYYFKETTHPPKEVYPKLLPVPVNAESLAIPRSTKEKGVLTSATVQVSKEAKKHRHHHHHHVDIKEDYVKSLRDEIAHLKELNDQQRLQYEAELKELKASRLVREEQVQQSQYALNAKIAELLERLHRAEQDKADITKDFLENRTKNQSNERQLQEENEGLRLEIKDLHSTVQGIIAKSESDVKQSASEADKRTDEVVSKYRRQAQMQSENLIIIKEQYKRIQEMYLAKIKELEQKLATANHKYKELSTRRNLEIEGFKTDVEQIRKKTRIYDEYLHRVKGLIDTSPKKAVKMVKSGGVYISPVRDQLDKLDADLGLSKSGSLPAATIQEPEKEPSAAMA